MLTRKNSTIKPISITLRRATVLTGVSPCLSLSIWSLWVKEGPTCTVRAAREASKGCNRCTISLLITYSTNLQASLLLLGKVIGCALSLTVKMSTGLRESTAIVVERRGPICLR